MNEGAQSKENDATATAATTTSRLAFGSCHKSIKSAVPPIWDTILPPVESESESESTKHKHKHKHEHLDAWLWLGDAMYPSHRDPITNKKYYGPAPPEEVEAGLRAMKHENATIGYKGFIERLHRQYLDGSNGGNGPLVAGVWDDHDFGGNDMGSHMPEKKHRKRIYRSFLGTRSREAKDGDEGDDGSSSSSINDADNGDVARDGMYHRVDLEGGKIRVLVLDTRWFREDHCIPSIAHRVPLGNAVACLTRWMTSGLLLHRYAWMWGKGGCRDAKVLGDEQWEWLENELLVESSQSSSAKASVDPPELFVVLSSIQVWSTNPIMEGWGHFPKEQERLWNLLRRHYGAVSASASRSASPDELPPAPVLFLSGDVHHGEISGQPGYYEITSSGMTHHCGQHKLYGRVCEPALQTFSDHRPGAAGADSGSDQITNTNTNGRDRYYIGLNYGVLEVVTTNGGRQREVRAQVRNATGHTVLEVTQALAGHGAVPVLPPYDQLAHAWDGHLIPYARALLLLATIGLASIRTVLMRRPR